jgi:hypothetical protein
MVRATQPACELVIVHSPKEPDYAFCKAHSTAYGVQAYQSAWLKRYYPAEFMAAVLTNGKGSYLPEPEQPPLIYFNSRISIWRF